MLRALLCLTMTTLAVGDSTFAQERPRRWPTDKQGLRFKFHTGLREIHAYTLGDEDPLFNYRLTAGGMGRINAAGQLLLKRGSFRAAGQGEPLLAALRDAPGLGVEAWCIPDAEAGELDEARDIVALRDPQQTWFALFQKGAQLGLRMQTTGGPRTAILERLPDAPWHVVASWSDGKLNCFVNGTEQLAEQGWAIDRAKWQPAELRFGCGDAAAPGWSGRLEGFAIYARALDDEEARANFSAYQSSLERREPVATWKLRVRLKDKSVTPTLEQLAPYRESLTVCEYDVVEVLSGEYSMPRVRVAHWMVLDGQRLPYHQLSTGHETELVLQRFADLKALRTANLSDTLEPDFDLDLYFDAGGASVEYWPRETRSTDRLPRRP